MGETGFPVALLPQMIFLHMLLLTRFASPVASTDEAIHQNLMYGEGVEYKIANSNAYRTDFHQDEYFEVYSPIIRTRYSEVYWRFQDPVSLPQNIVERFANGKVMAVTGYEVDQVRVVVNETTGKKEEVPVPITWAYNHHYIVYLSNSKKTKLVKRHVNPKDAAGHPHLHYDDAKGQYYYWTGKLLGGTESTAMTNVHNVTVPLLQAFSEGNGGEFRRSYHGYPRGYAQLIESPNTFISNPMHIDTWNRSVSDPAFAPGPLPSSSRIPANEAGFSGLIECPCSSRLPKKWGMSYALAIHRESGDEGGGSSLMCKAGVIQNATECFHGGRNVVQAQKHTEVVISDPTKPIGCSVNQHADGSVDIRWNTCNHSSEVSAEMKASSSISLIAFSREQVNVTVVLDTQNETATITMVGPPDEWFGLAFGSSSMCIHSLYSDECPEGGPYAIIVSGESVTERKLGFHGPGTVLSRSLTVASNSIPDSGNRTVVLTRPFKAMTPNHFQFNAEARSVPIISARGCSPDFAQHCGHGSSKLNFLQVDTPTRICRSGIKGTVGGNWFDNDRCGDPPKSQVKVQGNAACTVQTYQGGMTCCRDGQSLLDQEQELPWPDQYLEFRLKFRFYFQEYQPPHSSPPVSSSRESDAASHQNLIRFFMQTEYQSGEYDIEPCPKGTPSKYCVHSITSRWKVSDMMVDCSIREDASWCTGAGSSDLSKTRGITLIYVGPHCHAPSCLSMELYNADTGQLLCSSEPIYGKTGTVYDEKGFLAIPPCLYGAREEGLPSPVLLTMNTTLLLIKKNNSTYAHTGEMAYWQMRGVVVPKKMNYTKSAVSSMRLIEFAEQNIHSVERRHTRNGSGNR